MQGFYLLLSITPGWSYVKLLLVPVQGPDRGISIWAHGSRKEFSALRFRIGSQYKGQEVLYKLDVLC